MNRLTCRYIALVGLALAILTGCGNKNGESGNNDTVQKGLDLNNPALIKINNRLFSIPSPFQVAFLVKDSKLDYNKSLLNSTDKVSRYTTNFKKALNLGVYGANLGYLNVYEQYPDATRYFAVVKMLGKDLGITSTFDKETIKRIEENSNNRDSLMYILGNIYRDADAYLMNSDRNDVGVLVLAGGWVESLYFLVEAAHKNPSAELINRIGEQKHPLDNLIELLRPYYGKESEEMDNFIETLVDLATVFDGVTIEYTFEKPTTDPDKQLTIINSKSKTIITAFQQKTITEQVEAIRSKVVE